MNTPSATQQYVTNELPTDPSQITAFTYLSTAPAGLSAGTLTGYKVGKLYFGIVFANSTPVFFANDAATKTKIESWLASTLGFSTVNTWYGENTNLGQFWQWTGASWIVNAGTPFNVISGFLAN